MHLEKLESRIVFDHALGSALEFDIDTTAEVAPIDPVPEVPSDLVFRGTGDDFDYSSIDVDAALLDRLIAETEAWQDDPQERHQIAISDTEIWYKSGGYYPPVFVEDGHFEVEQFLSDNDTHQMLIVKKPQSDCYTSGGIYTLQDQHYRISFSMRHPESEISWLEDHRWSLVTQFWGPRESGESARNPPFSIYTRAIDGEPTWIIRSLGDSRRITQSGQYEEQNVQTIPMTNIGEWQNWDVEFVPNPFGQGLIRAWLNGEMVAEWKDIKNVYNSMFGDVAVGPVGPMFGLYSGVDHDGMEAHFDHISVQCSGEFQSSIAGVATGGTVLADNIVYARSKTTGETFASYTGHSGVFMLNVPKDVYTVTVIDDGNGHQVAVDDVDTTGDSPYLEVDLFKEPAPAPLSALTLTADVNGDGRADIINRLADGSWQVTVATAEATVAATPDAGVAIRDPRTETPTTDTPTTDTPTTETPTTETPTTETPTTETPTTDTPTTETPTTDTPTTETPTTETPTTETPTTETPTTETPTTDTPTTETPTTETPTTETPTTETPTTETPTTETPTTDTPTTETPTTETPTTDTPTTDTPTTETPTTETPTTETPTTETPTTETPTTDTPTTETPTTDTPTTETPTTDTPTTETPTTETPTTETPTTETPTTETPTTDVLTFSSSVWTKWSTNTEWFDIQVGDFTGDGLEDIAGRSADGNWWVAESKGDKFLTHHFGHWAPHVDWQQVSVGDFNGDEIMDIAGRAGLNGEWWIATSTGTRFTTTYWARWTTAVEWESFVGDFDGDGLDDIAGRASSDGTWWVGRSTGTKLQTTYWGTWSTKANWTISVGDFNGDGLSDVVGRADKDGTIWVGSSTGSRFLTSYWGRLTTNVEWLDMSARDIDGDGLSDLATRASSDGTWWIVKSHGNRFLNEYWGRSWSTSLEWLSVGIDDFDGDGDADLLGRNSVGWWMAS